MYNPERRRLQGISSMSINIRKGGCKVDGARPFSVMPSARTGCSGQALKTGGSLPICFHICSATYPPHPVKTVEAWEVVWGAEVDLLLHTIWKSIWSHWACCMFCFKNQWNKKFWTSLSQRVKSICGLWEWDWM